MLNELRKEWERGCTVVAENRDQQAQRVLVVLKDSKGRYRCHRYFTIGESNWQVSIDAQGVSADIAIQWAFRPRAVTKEHDPI